MTTADLNTIYGIIGPLALALLVYLGTLARSWLTVQISHIKDKRLQDAALVAAQAVKHELQSNALLSPSNEVAIVGKMAQLLPGVPTALLTPAVQAAAHVVNEATKQVVAQQTTAAATQPTVIEPDYQQLANTLMPSLLQGVLQVLIPPPASTNVLPASNIPASSVTASGAATSGLAVGG